MENVDTEIAGSVQECIKILTSKGVTPLKTLSSCLHLTLFQCTCLQRSEVSSNLSRYDGIRYGNDRSFLEMKQKRIMLGTYALSEGYADQYYKKAQKVRYIIRQNFIDTFKDVDVIFAPTTPITASRIGEKRHIRILWRMMDILTEPAAAAGIPAISIPSKLPSNGLPIGVQFMGKHLDEQTILNVSYQLEQNWHSID